MKAYFLTEEQVTGIIKSVREHCADFPNPRISYNEMAHEILDGYALVEMDDASIEELSAPCKFFPTANIVGFAQKDGFLKGVFIKE